MVHFVAVFAALPRGRLGVTDTMPDVEVADGIGPSRFAPAAGAAAPQALRWSWLPEGVVEDEEDADVEAHVAKKDCESSCLLLCSCVG